MHHQKPQKPRPLGSVRCISKSEVKSLNIPKLLPGINADTKTLQEGIHGSAITVSAASESVKNSSHICVSDRVKSDENAIKTSNMSDESAISHSSCKKKIQEGLSREKILKDQTESLSRQLEELKVALCRSEEESKQLKDHLKNQETQFSAQLNKERSGHEETRDVLCEIKGKLVEAQKRIERLIEEHREEIEKHKEESEKQLAVTVAEKDSVIADRDQKLARLKSQMADALKGNSWERQQQLDELTKDLSRLHEENDMLRMKMKSMSKNKQSHCSNCEEINMKATKLQAVIKDRDVTIEELKLLCSKFETQLSTQDKLLEQWALSKGHKIYAPK